MFPGGRENKSVNPPVLLPGAKKILDVMPEDGDINVKIGLNGYL
jgi:hypothetical protein